MPNTTSDATRDHAAKQPSATDTLQTNEASSAGRPGIRTWPEFIDLTRVSLWPPVTPAREHTGGIERKSLHLWLTDNLERMLVWPAALPPVPFQREWTDNGVSLKIEPGVGISIRFNADERYLIRFDRREYVSDSAVLPPALYSRYDRLEYEMCEAVRDGIPCIDETKKIHDEYTERFGEGIKFGFWTDELDDDLDICWPDDPPTNLEILRFSDVVTDFIRDQKSRCENDLSKASVVDPVNRAKVDAWYSTFDPGDPGPSRSWVLFKRILNICLWVPIVDACLHPGSVLHWLGVSLDLWATFLWG